MIYLQNCHIAYYDQAVITHLKSTINSADCCSYCGLESSDGALWKEVFLQILQNSQENSEARFLWVLQHNFAEYLRVTPNEYSLCNMRTRKIDLSLSALVTEQKMKFFIKDFLSKCNQIRSFSRKLFSSIENFISLIFQWWQNVLILVLFEIYLICFTRRETHI